MAEQVSREERPRAQISASRVTGKILDWKGTFGWITPDAPINHPEAVLRRGKIYLNQLDVEAEISGVGAHVSFYVYADGSGLGAMNCRPVDGPGVLRDIFKVLRQPATAASGSATGGTARSGPPGPRQRITNAPVTGLIKSWRGPFGWIVPMQPIQHPLYRGQLYLHTKDVHTAIPLKEGMEVAFFIYADAQGLGAEQCVPVGMTNGHAHPQPLAAPTPSVSLRAALAGGGGAAAGKPADRGPPGYTLPRQRLTELPTTGEVVEWRGAFGWVLPHEPVDHPEAIKRGGKLYVSKSDLQGLKDPEIGQLVQFHVFQDDKGLGAEEVAAF